MDGAGAHPGGGVAPEGQGRGWLGWLLPPATALVVIVVAVLVLTTPLWMHEALRQSGATQAFATPEQAFSFSDPTVNQLLFGGDFYIDLGDGYTFYTADEAAHLRDARAVLYLFVALALAALVLIVAALVHRPTDARRWRAVARGAAGLAVGTVVVGIVGFLVFVIKPTAIYDTTGPAALFTAGLLLWPLLTAIAAIGRSASAALNPGIWVKTFKIMKADYLIGMVAFYGVIAFDVFVWLRVRLFVAEKVQISYLTPLILAFLGYLPMALRGRVLGQMCQPYMER